MFFHYAKQTSIQIEWDSKWLIIYIDDIPTPFHPNIHANFWWTATPNRCHAIVNRQRPTWNYSTSTDSLHQCRAHYTQSDYWNLLSMSTVYIYIFNSHLHRIRIGFFSDRTLVTWQLFALTNVAQQFLELLEWQLVFVIAIEKSSANIFCIANYL